MSQAKKMANLLTITENCINRDKIKLNLHEIIF